jgi:uncharacterized repeat protein (TIGR01451 family)
MFMSRISVRIWILLAFGLSFSGASYAAQTAVNISSSSNGFSLQVVGGTVWAWGNNASGQLGDNTFVNHAIAAPVSGLTSVIAVAAGGSHSLALKTDGTVWAWGGNFNGQLGDGTFNSHPTPNQVPGLANVIAIAAGQVHSVVLKSDGTVWAWGGNFTGQVGDNTSGNVRLSPTAVYTGDGLTSVTAIAAGLNHSLAIKSGGGVWAWGQNNNGQLGDGTTTNRSKPVSISLAACTAGAATAIAGGNAHSLSVVGGVVCAWGQNNNSQLGDGTTTQRNAPIATSTLTGITAVAGGANHSLALKGDGTVWAWGANQLGQIGDTTTTQRLTPVQSSGITTATDIAAGGNFSVARLSSPADSLLTWGGEGEGNLGDGIADIRPVPIPISGLSSVSQVSAGGAHTLALLTGGTVMGLGNNSNGQLGDGSTTRRLTPVAVSGLSSVAEISAGNVHSLARKNDGTVWAWGFNSNGQLGINSTMQQAVPTQVVGVGGSGVLSSIAHISASGNNSHSLAVDTNGVVYAWGFNNNGQLGDGTFTQRNAPVLVTGLTGIFTAVAAGDLHSLALRNDGTVWAWGQNANGQLGNGMLESTSHSTPLQVPGLTNVVAIAANNQSSFAVKSDGSIWAWGSNNADLNVFQQPTPDENMNFPPIVSLAAGNGYNLVTLQFGGIKWVGGWGSNNNGQLGTGTFDFGSGVPALGFGGKTVSSISANNHSLALMTDGTVWGWGLDNNGQLGDSPTIFNATPTAPVSRTAPDLTITKSHASEPGAGSPYSFTITVKNVGGSTMAGAITVTDTLPAGMSFVSGVGTGWSCGPISGGASCTNTNAGGLAAGASSVITLTANTTALMFPDQFNQATVNNAGDPHALNNVTGNETIAKTPTTVSLTPAPSPNPSTYGQPVSLNATVTPSIASGYVAFGDVKDSGAYLGAVPVSAGTAHINTIALAPGVRQLEAVFVPDPSSPYNFSFTPPTSQTVNAVPAATLTPMASSPLVLGGSHVGYLVANADFNGDGKMDIAVLDPGSHAVTVYLGNGSGGFTPSIGGPFPAGSSPVAIAAVDLNRDGKVDLAIANQGGLNAVTVLLGNGAGGFAAAPGSPFAVGFSPTSIAVSDFNNDGTPRVAVAGLVSGAFAKLKRDTFGNFFIDTFTVPSGSRSGVASADFNADGISDLAFSDTAGAVGISLKDPNGGYIPLVSIPSTLPHPQGIVAADISGDGKTDLIVYDATGIELLIGNGSGGFAEAAGSPFVPGTGPITGISSVSVGDFNGDGKPDLFVVRIPTSTSKGEVVILRGDGSGHFTLPGSFYASVSSNLQNAVVSEFNGDGRTDVAVTDPGNDGVVLLQGAPFHASGGVFRSGFWAVDTNRNWQWDVSDKYVWLGQAGDIPIVGDFDGDGVLEMGIFRNGFWAIDMNHNGVWDVNDKYVWLGQAGDIPVVGDFDGDGISEMGVFRNGFWAIDMNHDGIWEANDKYVYLGQAGDVPVVGDFNGDGISEMGVFRNGFWAIDMNRDGIWEAGDKYVYLGQAGDVPVVGDFNGDGIAEMGIFRSGFWAIDLNRDGIWEANDGYYFLGQAGDVPVVLH